MPLAADRGKRLHYLFDADECSWVQLLCKACRERAACVDGGCSARIEFRVSTNDGPWRHGGSLFFRMAGENRIGVQGNGATWLFDAEHQQVLVECSCPRCRERLTRRGRQVDVPLSRIAAAMPESIGTTVRLMV